MKVLLINDFYSAGGAETVFRKTLSLLESHSGFDVRYYCGSTEYSRAEGALNYLYSRRHKNALKLLIEDFEPDIIHCHGYYHILSPSIFLAIRSYKKGRNIKVIYTAHDYHFLYANSSLLKYEATEPVVSKNMGWKALFFDRVDHRGWKYSLLKKVQWVIAMYVIDIVKDIDVFLSPSQFLKDLYTPYIVKPIHVIRNPTEINLIRPIKLIEPSATVRLLFFGRLSVEKGLPRFVEMMASKKIRANVQFDIYGSGPEEEKLRNTVTNNDLQDVIHFKGFVDHEVILDLLPSYDAMIIPSIWYENAPMSIVEAAFAGLYIVGSDIGGVAELSAACGNSVLFNPYSFDFNDILEEKITH